MAMRPLTFYLSVTLTFFGGTEVIFAQSVENGQRLSERWCSECHISGPAQVRSRGVPSFALIAGKEPINADMIASFLLLPHATMPNPPLSRKDALDIAVFILGMKK
jgi:mono/diheme cytochrome c family protein